MPQKTHEFIPPSDGSDDIVVTAHNQISDNSKYVLAGGQYYLNPHYNPSFDITLGQAIVIPPLIGAGAAVATSGEALFAGGRAGLLNNNPYVRIGWGPGANATRQNFYQQFRIVFGNKDSWIHFHIDIPGITK